MKSKTPPGHSACHPSGSKTTKMNLAATESEHRPISAGCGARGKPSTREVHRVLGASTNERRQVNRRMNFEIVCVRLDTAWTIPRLLNDFPEKTQEPRRAESHSRTPSAQSYVSKVHILTCRAVSSKCASAARQCPAMATAKTPFNARPPPCPASEHSPSPVTAALPRAVLDDAALPETSSAPPEVNP